MLSVKQFNTKTITITRAVGPVALVARSISPPIHALALVQIIRKVALVDGEHANVNQYQ